MKRLVAILIFALSIVSFCAAQIQTGNASYNSSKAGHFISHPSLSFNTRVKVTNLSNGLSVEAVVNGRIAPSPDRIADISGELGDILQMPHTGVTRVQIEELHTAPATVSAAAAPQSPPAQVTPAQSAPAQRTPAQSASPQPVPAPATPAAQTAQESPIQEVLIQNMPLETVTELRYVPVPASCPNMLCIVLLILMILVIVLLVVVLLVLVKPQPWPWYYPIWLRRHFRYTRRHRRH
jgi:hypothetical protein